MHRSSIARTCSHFMTIVRSGQMKPHVVYEYQVTGGRLIPENQFVLALHQVLGLQIDHTISAQVVICDTVVIHDQVG